MPLKRVKRAIIIALATFLVASGIVFFTHLEIIIGLDELFKIRGTRPHPSEVVVVAIDEASESELGVGSDLRLWRKFHANLVKQLQYQGAALVVFDLQFIASQPDHDPEFAAAMRQAGNVLIADCYQRQGQRPEEFSGYEECSDNNKKPIRHGQQESNSVVSPLPVDRINSPTEVLASAALDHAPFYLPNDAKNSVIRQTWTLSKNSPTLPVLAWLYYLERNGSLKHLITPTYPLSTWSQTQREQCLFKPEHLVSLARGDSKLGRFLFNILCAAKPGDDSRYIDYYGPPRTLRFESYIDVYNGKVSDLRGKVVFVGKAARQYIGGKTDTFFTPFNDAGKMAGVEIMATLFANLLEGRTIVMPFPPIIILPLFGLVIGLCLTLLGGRSGIVASLLFTAAYAIVIYWCFKHYGMWLPIIAPTIQLLLAWLIASLWGRLDAQIRERHMALAFAQRVPEWKALLRETIGNVNYDKAFDREITKLSASRDVTGLCLSTDIKDYTAIARRHSAHQLMELLQQYYQLLASPVRTRKGIIANVIGDSMMALWIDSPSEQLRYSTCIAALEIQVAVTRFNETSTIEPLYTRIGIHEGDMTLGKLVLDNPGNLNPIGDTANTASRIEGVNKYLGTQILASATIAGSLSNILFRPVGKFYLVGRDEAIELIEIIGMLSELNPAKRVFLREFAIGLNAFGEGFWQEAIDTFSNILKYYSHDGPSQFYLDLATAYIVNPPLHWDGAVRFEGK